MEDKSYKRAFMKFCHETSLHGWKYIAQSNCKLLPVLFWTIVIFLSTVFCGLMIGYQVIEFHKATISYELASMSIPMEELHFPSMVVCNKNTLRQSFLNTLMKNNDLKELTNIDDLQNILINTYITGTDLTIEEERILNSKSNF